MSDYCDEVKEKINELITKLETDPPREAVNAKENYGLFYNKAKCLSNDKIAFSHSDWSGTAGRVSLSLKINAVLIPYVAFRLYTVNSDQMKIHSTNNLTKTDTTKTYKNSEIDDKLVEQIFRSTMDDL